MHSEITHIHVHVHTVEYKKPTNILQELFKNYSFLQMEQEGAQKQGKLVRQTTVVSCLFYFFLNIVLFQGAINNPSQNAPQRDSIFAS